MRCLSTFLAAFRERTGLKHKDVESAKLATKAYLSVDAARSLVCNDCWNGLFAREMFRDLLEHGGRSVHDQTMRSFTYTPTGNAMEASSRRGCNWCTLIKGLFGDRFSGLLEQVFTIHVSFGPPDYDHCGKVLLGAQLVRVVVNDSVIISYPLYTLAEDPCADEILARDRIRQMRSTQTCRLALDHLSYCIENHDACPKPPQDRVLPTRVIDCTYPERPRLYITDGNVRGSYVALSYVWGEDQPNKTKRHNVDTYARGMDVDLLPQTAKDAIWVTNACGEKYLWIDAFCIIQDSKEDKRREIGKIPATFADASFTIIAARSSKASEGFLHDCPPPSVPICRLPFPCADDPSHFGTVYVEQDTANKCDSDCDVNDPVHKRAWCLEELLLSTRALVYTSNTLRFHCQMLDVNVGDAVRRVEQAYNDSERRLTIDWTPARDARSQSDSIVDANRSAILWENIVRNYTARTVTQTEDKLIALAGVAVRFGARWKKGAYLAGLWLDSLPHDLLWHVRDGARRPRPGVYRAPSWSWASVDDPVEAPYLDESFEVLYELRGHGVTLASDNLPFGAVTAGYLILGACLLKAAWRDDGLYAFPAQAASSRFREGGTGSRPETGSKIYRAWRDAIDPCSPDVWLLFVCSEKAHRSRRDLLTGLVVVPAGGPGEYRRVSYFYDYSHLSDWISKDNIEEITLQNIMLL